ncbi:MAG TPA: class I SAM-dependent methyltransferase [Limnochordia bacterium]|nr:class I SAM-dependent methyltransferase [Limnochordia bacterium]
MNDAYSTLARFYDLSMDLDYEAWTRYLLALGLRKHHIPSRILDLGCGTGNLTIPLSRRGYTVMGVDLSPAMIEVARKKAEDSRLDISFSVGDMRTFSLPGQVFDTVISGCDVVNYLTCEKDLESTFEAVHRLLPQGGLWFFDLNSAYKLQQIYGNESYADLQGDFGYFWDNSYDDCNDICTMELTFFVSTSPGVYEKRVERHQQKLWTPHKIAEISAERGFSLRGCYDFLTFRPWVEMSHRWQFVVEKK